MMILSEEHPYAKDQVEDQSHFGSHPLLTSYAGNLNTSGSSLMCTLYSTMRTSCFYALLMWVPWCAKALVINHWLGYFQFMS
jgi:hypothetical protein